MTVDTITSTLPFTFHIAINLHDHVIHPPALVLLFMELEKVFRRSYDIPRWAVHGVPGAPMYIVLVSQLLDVENCTHLAQWMQRRFALCLSSML